MAVPKLRFKADDGSEFPEWEEMEIGEITGPISSGNSKNEIGSATLYGSMGVIGTCKEATYVGCKILVARVGANAGTLQYVVEDCGVSDNTLVIKETGKVDFLWLFYCLTVINIGRMRFGGGQPLVTGKMIEKKKISIPSLPEQRKIASFLSTIDEIIQSTESELTAWQERKKGVMQKIFNREVRFKADDGSEFPEWEERRIDSFANCYAGATPSTKVAEYWKNGSIPWMSSGEVNNREIYETEKKISELGYEKSSTKMIKPNTVVIALAGQGKTRGMVAIARISVCTNQSLCAIETNDMVNDDYLYQYLITQYDNLRRISSGDGTRGGLNLQLVGEYKVFLPVLHEQKKIADCLSSLDDVISNIQAELSAWKEFKKGLLQQMFV